MLRECVFLKIKRIWSRRAQKDPLTIHHKGIQEVFHNSLSWGEDGFSHLQSLNYHGNNLKRRSHHDTQVTFFPLTVADVRFVLVIHVDRFRPSAAGSSVLRGNTNLVFKPHPYLTWYLHQLLRVEVRN